MRCPFCGYDSDRVIDSRTLDGASVMRRRRICKVCNRRYTTYERVEMTPLMVIKNDNSREPYNRDKLKEGLLRAFEKRPISQEEVEKIVAEIENQLQEFVLEVPSKTIGDFVLKKLYHLDPVAYVRFASVYKHFDDLNSFIKEIKKFKKNTKSRL